MSLLIFVDTSDADAEVDRILGMPTPGMVVGLEAVLEVGFDFARTIVHVQTGALKATGKKSSKTTAHTWAGEFSFDAGYAAYEQARGEDHDFMAGTPVLKPMFRAALLKGLRKNK